jgi:hypothetical protein
LAILFPTSAMYVTAFTQMDARFAAAACRGYNDWLHDYIEAADPAIVGYGGGAKCRPVCEAP